MGIGDWGLGIGDWGLGPIPNPQSPFKTFLILHLKFYLKKLNSKIYNKLNYIEINETVLKKNYSKLFFL